MSSSPASSAQRTPSPAERWRGWTPVIGLEVHCQLRTRTKLFCGCESRFGAEPNTLCCPVCTAQPGALPVLNRRALELAVRVALALEAEIAPSSRFDRKNYFYCDLPKGYQISQFDQPYCSGGGITLASGKRIRLRRIHIEEDAGKAIHDRGDTTLVDLNRAGIPLIESVTEADIATPEEAHEYLDRLKEILLFTGASDCDMEKGSLRVDVNVSVHRPPEPYRTRVELKNLNSFRNVSAAIEHELARQIGIYESGDPKQRVIQETRLFDATQNTTRPMRGKEESHDYRYFPDPDLLPIELTPAFIDAQRQTLRNHHELPEAKRARYASQFGLSPYDAGILTSAPELARYFEGTVQAGAPPKEAVNWLLNEFIRNLAAKGLRPDDIEQVPAPPTALADLIQRIASGSLNVPSGREVLRAMIETGRTPAELVQSLGLEQINDTTQLEQLCRDALAGKDRVIADVKAGKDKAIGALIGPIMKASQGKANPKTVTEILLRLVRELP